MPEAFPRLPKRLEALLEPGKVDVSFRVRSTPLLALRTRGSKPGIEVVAQPLVENASRNNPEREVCTVAREIHECSEVTAGPEIAKDRAVLFHDPLPVS